MFLFFFALIAGLSIQGECKFSFWVFIHIICRVFYRLFWLLAGNILYYFQLFFLVNLRILLWLNVKYIFLIICWFFSLFYLFANNIFRTTPCKITFCLSLFFFILHVISPKRKKKDCLRLLYSEYINQNGIFFYYFFFFRINCQRLNEFILFQNSIFVVLQYIK